MWIKDNSKKGKAEISDHEKRNISLQCQTLVEDFRKEFIKDNPNKEYDYLVDVYTKWTGNKIYFCEKMKSESQNRIADEYETKFVRLEYSGKNRFNISYMRHTGQWFLVATELSLKDCLEMMRDVPTFQPIN
jgi:hypothetical protein